MTISEKTLMAGHQEAVENPAEQRQKIFLETVYNAAHPVNGTQFTPQGLFRIYPRRPVYPHPEGLFMVQRILAMTGLFTMQPILSTTSSSPAQSQRHKHPLTSPFIPILLPPHFAFLPLANCESGKCYKLC